MKTVALVFPNQLFEITPFKDLKCELLVTISLRLVEF